METNIPNLNDSVPPTPLPPKNPSRFRGLGLKVFLPLLVIVGLIFAGMVYWINKGGVKKGGVKPVVPAQNTPVKQIPRLSPEDIKQSLLLSGKIVFPEYDYSPKELSLDQLPVELRPFVLNGASNILVRKVLYKSTIPTSGFYVSYFLPGGDLAALARMFYAPAGTWQILDGARTDTLGLLEFKKDGMQIRITYEQTSPATEQVKLLMMQK